MRTDIVKELDSLLKQQGPAISQWFQQQFSRSPAPFYASVDLRHSGFKIVPVDTNLFPAGFNNLSEAAQRRAIISFKRRLQHDTPHGKQLLILAENHTRNLAYLDNLHLLQHLLSEAGYETRIARLDAEEVNELTSASGHAVTQYPLARDGSKLITHDGFVPDAIIVNNDMTNGVPEILLNIDQPMMPSPDAGWHQRRKSRHFKAYSAVCTEFAKQFDLDCWKIWTQFRQHENVNFKDRTGLDDVAKTVDAVLADIQAKYDHYGISETPYVFIKADAGTYGMGIMTATSGTEVAEMNKKIRNKMQTVKEGAQNAQVLIQEGVPTVDLVADAPAEPMIYCIDGQAIGGAYRFNPERDRTTNLNARGMQFTGMCDQLEAGDSQHIPVESCNYAVYSLIAQLANLAAARECCV